MARVSVLGGGAVGSLMASTMVERGHEVQLMDRDPEVLEQNRRRCPDLGTTLFDASRPEAYPRQLEDRELVLNALPGSLGHLALAQLLNMGQRVVDISFTPERAGKLDPLARQQGALAIVDAGVAPGLSNLLAGQLVERIGPDKVRKLRIYVGGLPYRRDPPWEYAAPFSLTDVIEEYTRPARLKRRGRVVELPALSEPHRVLVAQVGELEAFLTDGLRSLLDLPVPEMSEHTLRYPGHAARVRLLREAGFFSTTAIKVGEGEIIPREVTVELLKDQWGLRPGEPEFTYLLVEAFDTSGRRQAWELLDRGGEGWTSMARATGMVAVAFAQLVLDERITTPGVHYPEVFGTRAELVRFVLDLLKRYQLFVRQA